MTILIGLLVFGKKQQHYILLSFALFKLVLNRFKRVELFVVINAIHLYLVKNSNNWVKVFS